MNVDVLIQLEWLYLHFKSEGKSKMAAKNLRETNVFSPAACYRCFSSSEIIGNDVIPNLN